MSIHDPCTCFTFQDVSDPSCPIHGGYHQVRELRPSLSPEQVLINPPKVPGTVEDSHDASIAEDIRSAARGLEHIAARLEAREAEIATVVAKLRSIAKQMNDAPFDYAELIGDWNEGIRLACQELEAARLGGATA